MTNQWDSEFTEEKLQDQIKAAKAKYKEIHWRIHSVEYWRSTKDLLLIFELDKQYRVDGQRYFIDYSVDINQFKCLEGKTEEELEKVTLLGEEAIQWEELDIHIGLDDLLMSIQLRENWLNSIK